MPKQKIMKRCHTIKPIDIGVIKSDQHWIYKLCDDTLSMIFDYLIDDEGSMVFAYVNKDRMKYKIPSGITYVKDLYDYPKMREWVMSNSWIYLRLPQYFDVADNLIYDKFIYDPSEYINLIRHYSTNYVWYYRSKKLVIRIMDNFIQYAYPYNDNEKNELLRNAINMIVKPYYDKFVFFPMFLDIHDYHGLSKDYFPQEVWIDYYRNIIRKCNCVHMINWYELYHHVFDYNDDQVITFIMDEIVIPYHEELVLTDAPMDMYYQIIITLNSNKKNTKRLHNFIQKYINFFNDHKKESFQYIGYKLITRYHEYYLDDFMTYGIRGFPINDKLYIQMMVSYFIKHKQFDNVMKVMTKYNKSYIDQVICKIMYRMKKRDEPIEMDWFNYMIQEMD